MPLEILVSLLESSSDLKPSPHDLNENVIKDEKTKGHNKDCERGPNPKEAMIDPKKIKCSILKNVFCISVAFTLLFTSFYSLVNIQSSLHREMGTMTLGALYAALLLSCFFLPTLIIKRLKPKWSVVLSMVLYSPYFASMYYPRYYTFVPSAFILGLAAAPLWAGKCTYLSRVAEKYSEASGESYDVIVVRFFGIFFFFLQTAQVWGNLLSSTILSVGVTDFERSEEFLQICGANFCPDFTLDAEVDAFPANSSIHGNASMTSTDEISEGTLSDSDPRIYLMTSIYLLLTFSSAAILAFVVDPLARYGIKTSGSNEIQSLIFATLKHMKKPYQVLIIPLTIWSGMEQGFLSADYTSSFVTCGIGLHMVGYSFLCCGVSDAIFSIAFTPLIKYMHRVPIFTFAALLNLAMIILMFLWRPHPDDYAIFFVIPTLWGMADAVWQTQINAFYGVIFAGESEAAFSNYRLWEALGFIIAYLISSSLCMGIKMYIIILSLVLGMAGYYVIEFAEWRRIKKASSSEIDIRYSNSE